MSAVVEVACLVLVKDQNRFLATLRPPHKILGSYWEFPGGKVERGEHPEDALRRELREELRLVVDKLHPLPANTYVYDFATIRLIPYLSYCEDNIEIQLVEHAEIRWVSMDEARKLKWAPADLPIFESLRSYLVI